MRPARDKPVRLSGVVHRAYADDWKQRAEQAEREVERLRSRDGAGWGMADALAWRLLLANTAGGFAMMAALLTAAERERDELRAYAERAHGLLLDGGCECDRGNDACVACHGAVVLGLERPEQRHEDGCSGGHDRDQPCCPGEECPMCTGDRCLVHEEEPCECDVIDRHGPEEGAVL